MCTISLVNSPSNLFTDFLSQRWCFCLLLTLDGLFFFFNSKLCDEGFFILLMLHLKISFDPKYFLYCKNECSFHVHLLQLMCFYIIKLRCSLLVRLFFYSEKPWSV